MPNRMLSLSISTYDIPKNGFCISSDTLDVKPTLDTYDEVLLCLVTNFSNLSNISWRIRLWILFVVNARLEAAR